MVSAILLFATAGDYKTINLLLIYFKDWIGDGETNEGYLMLGKNIAALEENRPPTPRPVPSTIENAWLRASISEIETFLLDAEERENEHEWFVCLDEQGVRDHTVIVAQKRLQYNEANEPILTKEYNKTRVPWHEAYEACLLLWTREVDFEIELCEQDSGVDGWLTYRTDGGIPLNDDMKEARERMLREYEENDWI